MDGTKEETKMVTVKGFIEHDEDGTWIEVEVSTRNGIPVVGGAYCTGLGYRQRRKVRYGMYAVPSTTDVIYVVE